MTALIVLPTFGNANDAEDAYVEANLIAIFYHELGHALIDVMELPVFGQEEDAADTASALFIDATFDEETALDIAYDAALGFEADAAQENQPAWWDVHGPDLQRFYNLVCLIYGADPEARDDFADDLELPEDRRDTCPDEFDLAMGSWGPVMDEISQAPANAPFTYEGGQASLTEQVIQAEVTALNTSTRLPKKLLVKVENCGEANAFYDLDEKSITICTEFEQHLRENAPSS